MNLAGSASPRPLVPPEALAESLRELRAADDRSPPDPEIEHLTALDEWLSADPAAYMAWIDHLGQDRLRSQESAGALASSIAELSGRLAAGAMAPFACGEALQVCLADLQLLEELDETDVPAQAVAALRRELAPAAVDLVRRLIRNLRLRRGGIPDLPAPARQIVRLSELAGPGDAAGLEPDQPTLVIPTAGRGTRLRSTIPKALVPIAGIPMIDHSIRAADETGLRQKVFVLRYRADTQIEYLSRRGHVVVQSRAEGNGHSAFAGMALLAGQRAPVVLAYSDCPFLGVESFRRLLAEPMAIGEAFRLSAYAPARPQAGRIMRDESGDIVRIDQPRITDVTQEEADGGLYALSYESFFPALGSITNDNVRGEYQLTDVIPVLRDAGKPITTVHGPAADYQSVDTPADLIIARLRAATGAHTPEQYADPRFTPQILAFLRGYGLRAEAPGAADRAGNPECDRAAAVIASIGALAGPLLDLAGDP